jgi:GT2 family glycosyltransferase
MSGEQRIFCDTFNANCVLIPFNVFQKLPNIDKKYTHSLGDFDYGLEAGRRGVPIVVSDFFVGKCNDNPSSGTWRDVTLSRRERLKKKESPKGLPRREWFYFVRKHFGFLSACISSMTPYVRILIGK